METAGVEPAPPRCKRGALPSKLRPQGCECGRVESNHHSAWPRVYRPQSSPMLSVRKKGRPTGFEPVPRGSRPRMLPLHHSHHEITSGDDRTRTGDFSADNRALWPSELRPQRCNSAGGIRTHGLELMRLARTASPLPRSLPGWNRTSGLRFPKPAGWPSPPQAEANSSTPGGSRTRPSRLRAGRHRRSTTGA